MSVLTRPLEEVLGELGLSPKDVTLYLTLLREGPGSVRQLASLTGINRGTVYDTLKHLQVLELVHFYNRETKQFFVAAPPARLQELARARAAEIDKATRDLTHVVAELEASYSAGTRQPAARMYEGPEGVRAILEDVLETVVKADKPEYFVYSSSSVREAGLYNSFHDYTEKRLAAGIHVKNISIGKGGKTAGLDERKYISGLEGTPTYILIYHGKVANIFLDKDGELVGLIIENPGIYVTQRGLFLALWERLVD
ncbi:MAG: helix-turn-helix domain-containing protein [Patescibacteria group bacterium]